MERARNWCVEVERQARGRHGCSVRYVVAVSVYMSLSDKASVMRKDAVYTLLLNITLFPGMHCTLAQDPRYLRFTAIESGVATTYNLKVGIFILFLISSQLTSLFSCQTQKWHKTFWKKSMQTFHSRELLLSFVIFYRFHLISFCCRQPHN
jgi:hypothetical protein